MKKKITFLEVIIIIVVIVAVMRGYQFWKKPEEASKVIPVPTEVIIAEPTPEEKSVTPSFLSTPGTVKPETSPYPHITPEMVLIEGGTFQMGSYDSYIRPVHTVEVNSFYIGKYEVTNKEYRQFDPGHSGRWSNDNYAVEKVNWYDAINYCNWLSDKEGFERCYSGSGDDIVCDFSKNGYRLPTEAEWEYACRAGTTTKYYWGDEDEMDDDYCWDSSNSNRTVHPVGQKKSNAWGLYDISGNVNEWCWDRYDEDYYKKSPSENPTGPSSSSKRVIRGGSWTIYASICQSAYRYGIRPDGAGDSNGFRLVKSVP